jgi:erythromycin esterase
MKAMAAIRWWSRAAPLAARLLLAGVGAGYALGAMPCAAAELTAKNLDFARWDARERPEGWGVQPSAHYAVARDCEAGREGRCALRISSQGAVPEGEFQPLGQSIGPGPAAGRGLRLSGWIRTSGVTAGWAGLWMRVEVERKVIVLDNMLKDGPRGTTGWKRFEVVVPVAKNATLVALGVLLVGPGTAWFDSLELELDASMTTGEAPKTQVVDPPRPRPTQALADDAALALSPALAPKVRAPWRAEARRAAQPIRSLVSDDFSDLRFLRPVLEGRRVVQLGESAHGAAEFNWLKVRLVKFLHEEMGFDVIAFESSLTGCEVANARVGTSTPVDVMRDCIFPTWHSSEILGLFEYLEARRRAGRTLDLAGFDVQDSGRARPEVSARLVKQVGRVDAELARAVARAERALAPGLGAAQAQEMKAAYARAADRVEGERGALEKLEARPLDVDLAIRELRSRVRYAGQLSASRQSEGSSIRDEGMADNLDFLLDRMYPGRKVVVWAHNFHVEKRRGAAAEPSAMGHWVARRRGAEVYTVGLFMGRGVATWNDRSRYEIVAPPPDSLEAVMANAGWRMCFFDLARAPADSWARMPLEARDWGVRMLPITPAESYDGLIYIDTVTPPEYL